jgi:rod shape-determining protein MreD
VGENAMTALHDILILTTAFVLVFLQSSFTPIRTVLGAQVDLLPSLMVYTSLSGGVTSITLLAVLGGLWLDSLSANPLGVSVLPLFLVGFIIQKYRGLILRDQPFAQYMLGLSASALVPVATVALVVNLGVHPMLSWFSLWQWIVMALGGAVVTPIWFWVFDRLLLALSYRPLNQTSFRSDRQIKRGRS